MSWLDTRASDVLAFAKNEQAMRFRIPYMSVTGGLRYYYPDFVVCTPQAMYVIETKGLETSEVPRKDQRMAAWSRSASALTNGEWRYAKVSEALCPFSEWDSLEALAQETHSLDS